MTDEQYVESLYKEDAELAAVREGLAEAGIKDVSVAAGYGRLLTMLVRMSGAKRVLEIGALGGYSGICMARGFGADGHITSLELSQRNAEIAERHMAAAGFGSQVSYRTGDAKESLKALKEEGSRFDFFFIDADKEGYPAYLDYALELANPGAVIVADNILLRGRTTNMDKQGPAVQAVRSFNERIASDERLVSTVLPGYDGLAVAIVK
ncbi:O-methyltransferase [Paenibacillus thailandensis]|uniref:O-methyltransferase n=1 Tax=Paenibacillus thailandensis TaxID=393250 RepID=A0ABW5R079_9BACL